MSIKKILRGVIALCIVAGGVWLGGNLRSSTPALESLDSARDKHSSPSAPLGINTGSSSVPLGVNTSASVPILMYHYIRENPDPNDTLGADLSVTPDMFTQQLTYLKSHGFSTISLDDLVLALAGSRDLPPKPIILTFDDGYDDVYTAVYPLLRASGMVGTSYVVTSFIGKPGYMDEREVVEIDKSGVVIIGSHSQYHVDLSKQTTKRATTEIVESKKGLEQLLGHSVNNFCYPSGKYTDDVVRTVGDAGYLTATTVAPGRAHTYNDRLTLTRVRIHGATTIEKFGQLVN